MVGEVGIVMTLYDRVSPTLKSIAGGSRAFDKSLNEPGASLKAYDKAQTELVGHSASLKKTIAETDVKVREAQKSHRKLKDEISKGTLDDAIDRQARLRRELGDTETATKESSAAYQDLYKQARSAASATSKAGNRVGGEKSGIGLDGLAKGLMAVGIGSLWSDALGKVGDAFLSSVIGEPEARMAPSTLPGAVSGGSMGAVLGGPGITVGAVVGALAGVVSGRAETFESKGWAFKNHVQEAAEGRLSARREATASGSSIAGGREQKQMASTILLGSEEEAAAFPAGVQDMAAMTSYIYDEITRYTKSLVKPFGADKSLGILITLLDASAALFLDESDNTVLVAGLSRMKLTDKTTQEYLNYLSERGIDVYEALSKWGGAAAVAEKVTHGEIRGSEAVEEILVYMQEQYGGLPKQMAGTYEGMVDNLADAEANAEATYDESYNEKRREGIQAQMDWLGSGAVDEVNRAIGAWQAKLENVKEQYQQEVVEAMMETDEYQQARAEEDATGMERLIMQAGVQGMNEYNTSEGAQLALELELTPAAAIRDGARSDQAYWDAGYRKNQEYSKGLTAGLAGSALGGETAEVLLVDCLGDGSILGKLLGDRQHAAGLERMFYSGYTALLHEGERVLTVWEARQAGQGGGAQVIITGDTFEVRQGSDIDAIAEALYRRFRLAQMGGVRQRCG